MVLRALMWSYGASIQDENRTVVLNSPQTVAAVEFMARLFKETMTNEVFSWNAASNNQGLVAGKLSYIVNSISAWRTAQGTNPDVADDVYFVPPLRGPAAALAAQHVLYNWIVPTHAAQRRTRPRSSCCTTRRTTRRPRTPASSTTSARAPSARPTLDGWLANDPFGSKPAEQAGVPQRRHQVEHEHRLPRPGQHGRGRGLQHVRHPEHVRPGRPGASRPPQQSVAEASTQVKAVFAKWRAQGLVGGLSMAVVEVRDLVKEYDGGVESRRRRGRASCARSTASTWPPRRASTSSCSARRAAARPRCCARSPVSSSPPPATCSSTATS